MVNLICVVGKQSELKDFTEYKTGRNSYTTDHRVETHQYIILT